jgi:hypothetical protein
MRRFLLVATLAGSAAILLGLDEATVLGAAALPLAGRLYTEPPGPKLLTVRTDLAMATTKKIGSGPDNAIGAGKIQSAIVPACPQAKHAKGSHPFAVVGFPTTTLKLNRAGKYAFSRTYTHRNIAIVASTLTKPTKLTVKISGTVKSSSLIVGTVKVTGKNCSTRTVHYSAVLQKGT